MEEHGHYKQWKTVYEYLIRVRDNEAQMERLILGTERLKNRLDPEIRYKIKVSLSFPRTRHVQPAYLYIFDNTWYIVPTNTTSDEGMLPDKKISCEGIRNICPMDIKRIKQNGINVTGWSERSASLFVDTGYGNTFDMTFRPCGALPFSTKGDDDL